MRPTGARAVGLSWLVGMLPVLAGLTLRADEPAKASPSGKPAWQRLLQGEDARKAEEQEKQSLKLQEAGKLKEALKVSESVADLRAKKQGEDHWEARDARWNVEAIRQVLRQGQAAREDYAASIALYREAGIQEDRGQFRKALPLQEKVLAIRRRVLGEDHTHTAESYNIVGNALIYQGRFGEAEEFLDKGLAIRRRLLGEDHPDTALSYNNLSINLRRQERFREALEAAGKALAIYRNVLGENNPDTAMIYNNQALILMTLGRYAEAADGLRKSLEICLRTHGEDHSDTATAYGNLALALGDQGRYAQAEEVLRKALGIRRRVLGEDHPGTAGGYVNLAANLAQQGRNVEAAEFLRKALDIHRRTLGEDHPDTAVSYHSLSLILHQKGRYAEAGDLLRKTLDIQRRMLGESHATTGSTYYAVGHTLMMQWRYAEAAENFRKSVEIRRRVLGEDHAETAEGYNGVGLILDAQGLYAEATESFRKALDIRRRALGENHPRTAQSYYNLSANLGLRGLNAEATENARKALDIIRTALGEGHPDTVRFYSGLARDLSAQGRYEEAEDLCLRAAEGFARCRLRLAPSGLERMTSASDQSPLHGLAVLLARNGKPESAWQRFEEGLARGTWDDLSARLRRPAAEQARQAELVTRLDRLDGLLESLSSANNPTPEQQNRRDELLKQRGVAQDELDAFARRLEQTYGSAAGQVFERQQIQASLPADAALLAWLDIKARPKEADPLGDHWAVLLRSTGAPAWVRLRGTGSDGAWADADDLLSSEMRTALQSPNGNWRRLAERLRRQRLEPLAKYLAAGDGRPAVRHLVVLPSTALAGVPVETFADDYTVSYALSGTLYTHLRKQPKPTTRSLLALGDPVFDPTLPTEKSPPLPGAGVLVTVVIPGANAARAGLKPNDVLLRYDGKDLAGPADLKPLLESNEAGGLVAVTFWRNGETSEKKIPRGKLGAVLAAEPAPQALANQRRLERRLASATRGGDGEWQPLPRTRAEVTALRRLFDEGGPPPTLLLDSQASEQRLDELAGNGRLGTYRFLHLATHGSVDEGFPLRSSIILSRDALPDAREQLEAGRPVFDGQLTAREVLERWHLDSELVTLSACQTALGRYERGEGFVGFAQAMILAGSRSVCLSLWQVDDDATALLMERFYRNLLGKREGLKAPMGKAAALAEAKRWLRGLSREEAVKRAAQLSKGVARGKGRPALPLLPAVPSAAGEGCPYAHPYYWAAFVLVGDPD